MASSNTNLLLNALPAGERTEILDLSKAVSLPIRSSLQAPEQSPQYAYFITSGIASVVVTVLDGGSAETGIIGREGVTGALSLLGSADPPTECFMQVAGDGLRIPFSDLRRCFLHFESTRSRILECIQQQGMTANQLVACNKLHDAEARLARWLLMVQDRTETDVLQLTQEFLAEMLGTRRTTVALVAGTLQRAGLIEYSRGKVTILSRERLTMVACDCYAVTRRLLLSLYQ